jgi:hypothetical protein
MSNLEITYKNDWKNRAIGLAEKRMPLKKGDKMRIWEELKQEFPDVPYQRMANVLTLKGFKAEEHRGYSKKVYMKKGAVPEQWMIDTLDLARQMMPLRKGDLGDIFKEIHEKHPQVSYGTMTAYLRNKYGITTRPNYKKGYSNIVPKNLNIVSMRKKGIKETLAKSFEDSGESYYGIARFDKKGHRETEILKLSPEEAMKIMEKRLF